MTAYNTTVRDQKSPLEKRIRTWFRFCTALGTLFVSVTLNAQYASGRLPSLGENTQLTLGQELKIGESVVREIVRDPDYVDDPVLVEYVENIWSRLRQTSMSKGYLNTELNERFAWELMLIRDKSVNAFALPGGFMGVHLGLISVVSNQDELASVLGHELSHISQRHIARMMAQQSQQTPLFLGTMLLGLIAASRSPNAAGALIMGGQAGAIQTQLNFSRDMEREADRVGFSVMEQAGYEPVGFVTMFQKLEQASRLNDTGSFPYLRSHPLTTERIADMQGRMPLNSVISPTPMSLEHAMISARARVLVNPESDEQHQFSNQANLATYSNKLGLNNVSKLKSNTPQWVSTLYAGALSDIHLKNWNLAQTHLNELAPLVAKDAAAQRLLTFLRAEFEAARQNVDVSIELLRALPRSRAQLLMLSEYQNATHNNTQAKQVADNLQLWLSQHPRDALAWEILSSALLSVGNTIGGIRADAEAMAAHWDYSSAVDRLKAAQDLIRQMGKQTGLDQTAQIEASIVDVRLRNLEFARKEQALER
jgi:predicted Zn-dependent protease